MYPTVQLQLDSRPESVALVRAMLAGVSELLEFGPELLADLKTAVSEICNNVVMHAYGEQAGPMEVILTAQADTVEVTVVDHGRGMAEAAESGEQVGVGFAVVEALSDSAEFSETEGGGTCAKTVFSRPGLDVTNTVPAAEWDGAATLPGNGDVVLTVAPVGLLTTILGRIAGCVAAEAHFSIDRYSDLYLVTDGISAHAREHAHGDSVTASLAARPRQIELTVGPFTTGTASELQSHSGGAPQLLALLVDGVAVEPQDEAETLRLMVIDRRQGDPSSS